MYNYYSGSHGKDILVLHAGEHLVSKNGDLISTVLGSCIAVILYDTKLKIGGMNHFMLPESFNSKNYYTEESGRYGIHAMELLINAIMKVGAQRRNLTAKIFGGSHVLPGKTEQIGSIPEKNIDFAFKFLETEKIPVVKFDVGGDRGRKIILFTDSGKVHLKRLGIKNLEKIEVEELDYLHHIRDDERLDSDFTVFKKK